MDLYEKVKFVEGETFLTIEETKNLTHSEMVELIDHMRIDPSIRSVKNVIVLVNSKFNSEIDALLENNGFELRDENITVRRDLDNISLKEDVSFSFKSLNEISTSDFQKVWKESMDNSLNASSSLNVEEQMRSVEVELGSTYKASCLVAYESKLPLGVVMPHIEPGTTNEGRLFYFGLVPNERGKGKSKQLHKQALEILKNDFDASYYIGSTGKDNLPMLKTFQNSGCTIVESNKVYKRKE
ncbi:GNAT family N-acetyltransferase [Pseudalkalibacillus sp. JSM 102089]|uniref:GNAT family N-acetyltransferase n=1 Tax=Pseudalkalibacillus sp. JSM 102089 TaxID=3229856 RepID=UPI00352503F6